MIRLPIEELDFANFYHVRIATLASLALGLVMFLFSTGAIAALSVRSADGTMGLKLHDTACTEKVLRHLVKQVKPELLAEFRAATLYYGGRNWESCWIERDGVIYSIDEDGALFQPIPKRAFREDTI